MKFIYTISIEFTQSQIKAYENGATRFIVPIELSEYQKNIGNTLEDIENIYIENGNLFIYLKGDYRQVSKIPIQKGDKDIWIKEEFIVSINENILYKNYKYYIDDLSAIEWKSASEMTKEQSRYTISECIDVRVVRVQDILHRDWMKTSWKSLFFSVQEFYNNQLKEQNINRTYEDNDYIFLIKIIKE